MNPTLKYMLTAAILLPPCVVAGETNDADGSPSASSGSVRFETETFARSSGDCREQQDGCATISMTYPVATEGDGEVVSAINERVLRSLVASIGADADYQSPPPPLSEAADHFLGEYQELASEAGDRAMGWSVETIGEVAFQNRKLAVLSLDTYSNTGGAHPNSHTELFNFDTATGKTLGYEDFVSDIAALAEIAERKFKLARELPENADLAEEGFFWDKEFNLSQNFAITKEGLRLVYNSYEAAPYAAGPTEFVIPWSELGDIIDRGKIY